jgi:hypothetical protein
MGRLINFILSKDLVLLCVPMSDSSVLPWFYAPIGGGFHRDYDPFGSQLPKIKVDPNQKGWTPIWMREDSQEFEK